MCSSGDTDNLPYGYMASRGGETPSETRDAPKTPALRQIHLTDVIELFRDPETEKVSEGYAMVWEILGEDEMFYELVVSFMSDPAAPGRKFTRKYRKWE